MTRSRTMLTLAFTALVASAALSASLEEASRLYNQGSIEEAAAQLGTLLGDDASNVDRAEALRLAGEVAVALEDYAAAKTYWSELTTDFPDSEEAASVRTEMALVSALLASRPPTPERPEAPAAVAAPAAPPTPAEAAPAAPSAPSAPAAPAAPAAPTVAELAAVAPAIRSAPPSAPANPNLVLIAARGKPFDAAQETLTQVHDHLLAAGVAIESATEGVSVVQDSDSQLMYLLQVTRDRGAGSLLYVTAFFDSAKEGVKAECYSPSGELLWKDRIRGGTGWTGRPPTKSKINQELVDRMLEKLEKRAGGRGLPTG